MIFNIFRIAFCLLLGVAPLSSQPLTVTLLGTAGGPTGFVGRAGPSVLVEAAGERLLFDAGRGAMGRLRQLNIRHVSKLFLTHLHSDHVVGLTDVWLTGWVRGRPSAFEVWGPEGTTSMTDHLEQAFAFDIYARRDIDSRLPGDGVVLETTDIQEGVVFDRNGVKVTAFDVDHRPIAPALGFRIDYRGRSVAISGDTRPSDNLVKFSTGVDLLVHEVYGANPNDAPDPAAAKIIQAHHTTLDEAAEIFSRTRPSLAVYYHITPRFLSSEEIAALPARTNAAYEGRVESGEELMRIEIDDEIRIMRFGDDYPTP